MKQEMRIPFLVYTKDNQPNNLTVKPTSNIEKLTR